jgi:tetratricopeptide (TPR) repeat protein
VRLFQLLIKLKENYTEEKLKEVTECIEGEMNISELFIHGNYQKAKQLLNGQNEEFYKSLAVKFVDDLNNYPDMYFLTWEPLLSCFNNVSKEIFFVYSLQEAVQTDATDFINGIVELEKGKPEIACFHFNRIDDYVAAYFLGMCYMELEGYENAIKNYQLFLNKFEETIQGTKNKNINLQEVHDVIITKWNVYMDLGYCFNRLEEYDTAKTYYAMAFDIFGLEDCYEIYTKNNREDVDDFQILINNYLLSLEKTDNYTAAIEVLNFTISKYPLEAYFRNLRKRFEEKLSHHDFANQLITRLFKPRKPFNINKFEEVKLIAREKALEDMIVEQIKYGFKVFNRSLEIYQDDNIFGRQYYISSVNGILDLLLIDKVSQTLYVVELKRNEAGVEVVDQIERYMKGLSKELKKEVKGIICLHKPDEQLFELVKTKDNIELYTYHFEFNKLG